MVTLLSASATRLRRFSDPSARARPPCGPMSSADAVGSVKTERAGNATTAAAVALTVPRNFRLLVGHVSIFFLRMAASKLNLVKSLRLGEVYSQCAAI